MPGYEEAPIWNRSCEYGMELKRIKTERHQYLSLSLSGCNLPGDNDSWYCDADMADSRVRHCSPVCSASCRCTTGSQTVPTLSAAASPVCGIWHVDFETKPAKKTKGRADTEKQLKRCRTLSCFCINRNCLQPLHPAIPRLPAGHASAISH